MKVLEEEYSKYTYEDSIVPADDLKEEAIKHIKNLKLQQQNWAEGKPYEDYGRAVWHNEDIVDWIKHFFSITEEELK